MKNMMEKILDMKNISEALKAKPRRIIIGEARGEQLNDLIKAMENAHPSMITIHCDYSKMKEIIENHVQMLKNPR